MATRWARARAKLFFDGIRSFSSRDVASEPSEGIPRPVVACAAILLIGAFAWHSPKAFGESLADHAARLSRSSDPFFQHAAASRFAFVAKYAPHALQGHEDRMDAMVHLLDSTRKADVRMEALRAIRILLDASECTSSMIKHSHTIQEAVEWVKKDEKASPDTLEVAEALTRHLPEVG